MTQPTVADFSTTPASNTDFSGVGVIGASLVSTADDAFRTLAALIGGMYQDMGGIHTAGGSATVATVTTSESWTAYANGLILAVKMPNAATGATTLNVTPLGGSALGAKAIRREGDTAIAASDWLANSTVLLRYDTAYNSAAGAWVLLNQNRGTTLVEFDIPNATVRPLTDGSLAVGDTTHGLSIVNFSGVLGSGAYWGNAAISITISSTTLRFLGATTAYSFDSLIDLSSGASSVGVKFPASQIASANANTLDDYAEATWTPVFAFGGASVGQTYSLQGGRSTKIGRHVTLEAQAVLTVIGSSTGAATITGLPFAPGLNGTSVSLTAVAGFSTLIAGLSGTLAGATITVRIPNTTASAQAANTNFSSSSNLSLGVAYSV